MEKLFHPYMSEMNLGTRDPDMLKLCAEILQAIGWFAQQGMPDQAFGYIRLMSQHMPDDFLKACANGLDLIQGELKKIDPDISGGTIHKPENHSTTHTL